jgi:HEAT repeat protein
MGTLFSQFESEHQLEAQTKTLREIYGRYHEAAAPGLLKIASQTTDNQTKWLAISALGELHFEHAGPFIVECLRDDDFKVREAAALALSRIKDPASVMPLIETLRHEHDPVVVRYIADALSNQGSKAAIPALKSKAHDGPTQTRLDVISAIANLGSRGEVPYLATFLDDKDQFVAITAARFIEWEAGLNFDWCGKDPCGMKRIELVKDWWKSHESTWK